MKFIMPENSHHFRKYPDGTAPLKEVKATHPCLHCGGDHWCYSVGELSVCKKAAPPATGWQTTGKTDRDGTPYYAPKQLEKTTRLKNCQEFIYLDRHDQKLIKVKRLDDGTGKKKFPQSHWDGQGWVSGVPQEIRSRIPIYRYREVITAIAAGETIFLVEGEGCADRLYAMGLIATTTLGGSGKYRSYGDYSQDLAGADLVLCPDRDEPGLKHMLEIAKDFPHARWLYAPPGDFFWSNLPKSQGLDIADWITDGASAEDIRAAIQSAPREHTTHSVSNPLSAMGTPDPSHTRTREKKIQILTAPPGEEIFTQKAQDALYGDTHWISLNNSLYRWTGTYYKLSPTPCEKRRISQWCGSTPFEDSNGHWKFAHAKPTSIDAIWNWVLIDFSIDPGAVNPPGINCLNGFLQIQWDGPRASWQLLPHDPERYCTYVSEIEFNPHADPTECERLLACLDKEQQQLFVQTLAASLDLATIRKYRGREVKALLLKGHGNNGKDSLREAVRLLYGIGLSNATVTDFLGYDQGRKFSLAKLEGARINWSSENSSFSNLDGLQSLKAAITGDPIDMERKGVDEHQMMPACIFLFNINEAPNLKAGLEAIQSRWAVLTFTKTYKIGADPAKGELEADSRFRYDPAFLRNLVVPGLLNKMLTALPQLMVEGISYKCTDEALQTIQQETNHLWAFAQEVGLDYQVNGRVYVNDLWERLRDWYIANGTLIINCDEKGKEKAEWHDQPRRGDKNVKAANQVHQRFCEIFPKIMKERDTSRTERTGQFYLSGIGIEANVEAVEANVEAVAEAVIRTQSHVEAAEAIKPSLAYVLGIVERLSLEEQEILLSKFARNGKLPQIASAASTCLPESDTASATASTSASTASTFVFKDIKVSGEQAGVIGSTHNVGDVLQGGSSKNFPEPSGCEFKLQDHVAMKDPEAPGYIWHGRIIKIEDQTAKVYWDERDTPKYKHQSVLTHQLKDLRLI